MSGVAYKGMPCGTSVWLELNKFAIKKATGFNLPLVFQGKL